jgi:ubiquinone/menaquinone biosynthesis C-methylase UbiE
MIMERHQSGFSYKLMAFQFKLRDLIRPRGKILSRVGIKPGDNVLDFGCGPGGYALPAAKIVGGRGKIYALDINPAAILAVKSLAHNHKLNNVETILSDGPTGLPDRSIDVVLLYDVLHHVKTKTVLPELRRVLKPHGILSVSDHHLEDKVVVSKITGTGLFRFLNKNAVFTFKQAG